MSAWHWTGLGGLSCQHKLTSLFSYLLEEKLLDSWEGWMSSCDHSDNVTCFIVKSQCPLSCLIFHFTVEFICSTSNFGAPLWSLATANTFIKPGRNLEENSYIVALSLFHGLWNILTCIFLLIPQTNLWGWHCVHLHMNKLKTKSKWHKALYRVINEWINGPRVAWLIKGRARTWTGNYWSQVQPFYVPL